MGPEELAKIRALADDQSAHTKHLLQVLDMYASSRNMKKKYHKAISYSIRPKGGTIYFSSGYGFCMNWEPIAVHLTPDVHALQNDVKRKARRLGCVLRRKEQWVVSFKQHEHWTEKQMLEFCDLGYSVLRAVEDIR